MSKFNKFFEAKNAADKKAVINIMGDIGDWWDGNTAQEIATQLRLLGDVDEIDVYINSYGGLLSHGLSICNQLRRFDAKINTFNDGIAASAGSIIFLAGDRRVMPNGTALMVHNPMNSAFGYADDLRKAADDLDVLRESLVALFVERTGLEKDAVENLLDSETVMAPERAKELNFATEISEKQVDGAVDDENMVINGLKIPRSRFENMPQNILNSFKPAPKAEPEAQNANAGDAGKQGKECEPMNLETLKAQHPDVYNAVKAEAINSETNKIVKAERERIMAINSAVMPGFESLASEAINSDMSAGEFALKQLKAIKEKDDQGATNHLDERKKSTDAMNSIKPDANEGVDGDEVENAQEADIIVAAQNSFKGQQAR